MSSTIFKCTNCGNIFKCKADFTTSCKDNDWCACDECNGIIICGTKLITDPKIRVSFSL